MHSTTRLVLNVPDATDNESAFVAVSAVGQHLAIDYDAPLWVVWPVWNVALLALLLGATLLELVSTRSSAQQERLEVDAVVFLQETSNPRASRLRVRADTYPAAVKISGIQMTAFRVEKDRVMLITRDDYSRYQNVRLAVRLRLQKRDNGDLAQIEFLLPHKCFERPVHRLDVCKNKVHKR